MKCEYCGYPPLPDGANCCDPRPYIRQRDAAREVQADTARMLDQAREAIDAALTGVDEYDSHSGWWWDGAVKAISALRQAAK